MTTDPQPVDTTKAPEEFEQITVRVGPGGHRAQRFYGRLIAENYVTTKGGVARVRVYRSRKGKYVVHKRQSNWLELADVCNWGTDWKTWVAQTIDPLGEERGAGDYTVDIVDTLAELRGHVPNRVYCEVADVEQHPAAEDLDV
ncbi:EXLDI protein [Nocardia sp. NPDC048505]|uniref:EXLDI protein n=1 Tax=unclassified Nocardia TaxID=2637762 RepID=UPI003408147A